MKKPPACEEIFLFDRSVQLQTYLAFPCGLPHDFLAFVGSIERYYAL